MGKTWVLDNSNKSLISEKYFEKNSAYSFIFYSIHALAQSLLHPDTMGLTTYYHQREILAITHRQWWAMCVEGSVLWCVSNIRMPLSLTQPRQFTYGHFIVYNHSTDTLIMSHYAAPLTHSLSKFILTLTLTLSKFSKLHLSVTLIM